MVTKKALLSKSRALEALIKDYNTWVKSHINEEVSTRLNTLIDQHISTAGQVNLANKKDKEILENLSPLIECEINGIQHIMIMAMQECVRKISKSDHAFLQSKDIARIKKILAVSVHDDAKFKIKATKELIPLFRSLMMNHNVAPAVVRVTDTPENKRKKTKTRVVTIEDFPLPKLNTEQEALHQELLDEERKMNQYLKEIKEMRQKCKLMDDPLIQHQRQMIKSLRDEIKNEIQSKRDEFIKKLQFLFDVHSDSLLALEKRGLNKEKIIHYLNFFELMSKDELAVLRENELTENDIQKLRNKFNIVMQEMTAMHVNSFFPRKMELFKYNRDEIKKGYDLIGARLKELDPTNHTFLNLKAQLNQEMEAIASLDQDIQGKATQYLELIGNCRSGTIRHRLQSRRDEIVAQWNDIKKNLLSEVELLQDQSAYITQIPLETDRIKKQLAILKNICSQADNTMISLAENAQEIEFELHLATKLNLLHTEVEGYQEQVNLLKRDSARMYQIKYKKDIEQLIKLLSVASDKRDVLELESHVGKIARTTNLLYREIYKEIDEKINHLESLANNLLDDFSIPLKPFIDSLKGLRANVQHSPSVGDFLALEARIKQQEERYERAFLEQKRKIKKQNLLMQSPVVTLIFDMSGTIQEEIDLIRAKNENDSRIKILQSLNGKLLNHLSEHLNRPNQPLFIKNSMTTIKEELTSKNLRALTDDTAGQFIVFIRKLLTPLHNFLKLVSGEAYSPHFFATTTEIAVAKAAQKANMGLERLMNTIDNINPDQPRLGSTRV